MQRRHDSSTEAGAADTVLVVVLERLHPPQVRVSQGPA